MKLKKILPVFILILIIIFLYRGFNRSEQLVPKKEIVIYEIPEGIDPDKKIVINGHEFDPKSVYSTDPTIRRITEKAMEGAKRGPLARFGSKEGPQRHPYTVSSVDEAWYNSEVEVKKNKFEGVVVPLIETTDGEEHKNIEVDTWTARSIKVRKGARAYLIHFRNMSEDSKSALGFDIKMADLEQQIKSKNVAVRQ